MPSCSSHLLWPVTQVQSWKRGLDLATGTLWRLQGVKETIPPEVSSLIKFDGEAWNTLLNWRQADALAGACCSKAPTTRAQPAFSGDCDRPGVASILVLQLDGGPQIAISVPGQCATWCSANIWQPSIHSSFRCGWTVRALPGGTVSELPHGLLLQMEEESRSSSGALKTQWPALSGSGGSAEPQHCRAQQAPQHQAGPLDHSLLHKSCGFHSMPALMQLSMTVSHICCRAGLQQGTSRATRQWSAPRGCGGAAHPHHSRGLCSHALAAGGCRRHDCRQQPGQTGAGQAEQRP